MEAGTETVKAFGDAYEDADDASATSVGTDSTKKKQAQQRTEERIDTMTDRKKLEDSLNAEYAEDEGNPTRQRTRQAFDLITALLPIKGPRGARIPEGPKPASAVDTQGGIKAGRRRPGPP